MAPYAENRRVQLFRTQLMNEFRIGDTDRTGLRFITSEDILLDDVYLDLIKKNPHNPINFKRFKRLPREKEEEAQYTDQRMLRLKNIQSAPLSVYARYVYQHPICSNVIMLLILLVGVSQGVRTLLPKENYVFHQIIELSDIFCFWVFGAEIFLKWIDNFTLFWKDGWNVFDFIVTFLPAILVLFARDMKNLAVFRTVQLFKFVPKVKSLRVVVGTVLAAMQELAYIVLLLFLLMYLFAILTVSLFRQHSTSQREDLEFKEKFVDLKSAFMTLFQLLTLDQWYNISQDISKEVDSYLVGIVCFLWVIIGAFVFRNIFVGVMVKKFDEMSQEEKIQRKMADKSKSITKDLAKIVEDDEFDRVTYRSWKNFVDKVLKTTRDQKRVTHISRKTLFRYLLAMDRLCENTEEIKVLLHYLADQLTSSID